MEKKKAKNYVFEGPVPSEKVAKSVENHAVKTHCGAHSIFLAQVRAETTHEGDIAGVEFMLNPDEVNPVIAEIREEAFEKWDLACLHIYHSSGKVPVGAVNCMIMVSSSRSANVFPSLEYLVQQIKERVPIRKELYFG